jgi:hypothetical protein
MEDLLIEVLSQFGYPVKLQGSLLPDEPYPDHFFTFWNNDSYGEAFYDDDEKSITYDYDVNFYSINPELVYTKLREAKTALKRAGFIVSGDGYSVGSDEPTHDGRGINVKYLKF